MPAFSAELSRQECTREIGADPGKFTVLLMAGGLGVGGIFELAERLTAMEEDFQVIALAGKNERLLTDLKQLAERKPGRLFPMGFTKTIERLMTAADVAVTKPGGLTSSECIAKELPMIVVSPIPGQEERNSDYLLENGAAVKANDADGVEYKVRMLLENPGRLRKMAKNAKSAGTPDAAKKVLKHILG
jgi:processive 1,2-diacylglycerol beta-glucosyltransferase